MRISEAEASGTQGHGGTKFIDHGQWGYASSPRVSHWTFPTTEGVTSSDQDGGIYETHALRDSNFSFW
ncbi:hypothetical protein ACFX13_001856 [Malus domestica]